MTEDIPKMTTEERQAFAVDMRRRSHTYEQIGKALGISRARANHIVKLALDHINKKLAEDVSQLQRLEGLKLDELERQLWSQVGDAPPPLKMVDTLLRIASRRAKLFGLDAAVKFDPAWPPPWIDPAAQRARVEGEVERGEEVP